MLERRPPNDILYVDLNSCFATIEQQARPMLRGRPVAITNRLVPNSCIIAASYEAKALGVKVGMRSREASAICPDLIYAETEPDKFIFVHEKLKRIMSDYSASVVMKSIDEGVIDLTAAPEHIYNRNRYELGYEIKQRLKDEIGCYMRCNVGIASNRFLAKLAGELHKPDGLDEITAENQRSIFATLKLTDLPGINVRMEARLNAVGIFTPIQFLDADEMTLVKLVCKSIDGHKWYRRLRGIEVDSATSDIKSVGRQFVLDGRNLSREETEARLVHLAEDVGYRLRSKSLYARGIYVWTYDFSDGYNHRQLISKETFNTDHEIARLAKQLYAKLPCPVRIIGITLYKLQASANPQLCFEQAIKARHDAICSAEDKINLRFGARKIHCADSLGTEQVKCKIPFGSTRYLDHSIN
ncbi:DNA polymerase IV [Candidatus Saccharibacteria bacterium]|nr:DNA polymerase IV [Candidatus Saccharibacteria bacterium]